MNVRFGRVWQSRQGLVAILVILGATVWRGWLLRDSFFNQDDYYLTSRASQSDLTWSFLVNDTAGHVNPAQQLVYWIVARLAPFDWPPVAVFLLVLQMSTVIVLWYVLSRLLPGSWIRLPLLLAVAVAPLTLASTLWWSAAMGLWPPLLALLVAVLFLQRAADASGWRSYLELAGCLLAVVVGLLWHERAILIPPVLLGVAVCLADDASGWRRILSALRRFLVLWVGLALLGAGFLVAHSRLTDVVGGSVSLRQAAVVTWAFIGENVVPGIAGGPWAGELTGGAVVPTTWVVVVAIAAVLVGAVALLRVGGPARRWALGLLVAYVGCQLALLIGGRGGFGRVIGLDSRYSADIVVVAVLFVALALRGAPVAAPTDSTEPAQWSGGWGRTGVELVALYTLGVVVGTALLVPHFQNVEDRTYFTNLRHDLAADPSQVLYDQLVPADILLPLVGEESLLSNVLAPLPDGPAFDQPSAQLRVVRSDGHLEEPDLDGAVVAVDGPDAGCGYAATGEVQTVRLRAPVQGKLVVQIGYYTNTEGGLEVAVRGQDWSASVGVERGPHLTNVVVPDFDEPVTALLVRSETGSTVCVTGVRAGVPARS